MNNNELYILACSLRHAEKAERNMRAHNKELYESAALDSEYISKYYSKDHVLEIWKEYYPRIYNKYNKEK